MYFFIGFANGESEDEELLYSIA
uniref:Uncharacterized protein n=1 Tax=Tetranychus urticae TaxID=32264 RepID=T1K6Q7_TETUR